MNEQAEGKTKKLNAEPAPKIKKVPICGNDLLTMQLKPLEYLVDGMLATQGVYLLAGASKMGKSWLTIDLSIAISNGTDILGKKTKQSSTLYIDLESNQRSIKSRLYSMYGNSVDLPNWKYLENFESIGEGFEENITELIKEHNFKLIVIDVFVKIRSVPQRGATEYRHDYADLGVLKRIAAQQDVCFLVVTHLRKMKDEDDVFNTMTGSTALMGASDGTWLLARRRGEDHAVLHTDGREIRNNDLALKWDKTTTRWQCLGRVEDVHEVFKSKCFVNSPLVIAFTRMIADNDGEITITPTNLFNKLTFDYSDIDCLPTTPNILGKVITENITKFHSVGIDIQYIKTNKFKAYKIKKYVNSVDTLISVDTLVSLDTLDTLVSLDTVDTGNIFL